MPQASDKLRNQMRFRFGGTGVDSNPPERWLVEQGWRLTDDFRWIKPTFDHEITDDERDCVKFLIDEWDYGGIVQERTISIRGAINAARQR